MAYIVKKPINTFQEIKEDKRLNIFDFMEEELK